MTSNGCNCQRPMQITARQRKLEETMKKVSKKVINMKGSLEKKDEDLKASWAREERTKSLLKVAELKNAKLETQQRQSDCIISELMGRALQSNEDLKAAMKALMYADNPMTRSLVPEQLSTRAEFMLANLNRTLSTEKTNRTNKNGCSANVDQLRHQTSAVGEFIVVKEDPDLVQGYENSDIENLASRHTDVFEAVNTDGDISSRDQDMSDMENHVFIVDSENDVASSSGVTEIDPLATPHFVSITGLDCSDKQPLDALARSKKRKCVQSNANKTGDKKMKKNLESQEAKDKNSAEIQEDHTKSIDYSFDESSGSANYGTPQTSDRARKNPEAQMINLLNRKPAKGDWASAMALIGDGFRILFDMQLSMKSQMNRLMDKLETRVMGSQNVEGTITTVRTLETKYNLTLPMDHYPKFQEFDRKLSTDGQFQADVKAVLELSVCEGSMSKSVVSMLKKFISRNLGIQFVGSSAKKGQYAMASTRFFTLMTEVILKGRTKDIKAHSELRSKLSSVLSNAAKWNKKGQATSVSGDDASNLSGSSGKKGKVKGDVMMDGSNFEWEQDDSQSKEEDDDFRDGQGQFDFSQDIGAERSFSRQTSGESFHGRRSK